MRLLILGGTWFLGRALAEEAVRRGLCVTTFNRGLSGPDTPGVRALRGDRSSPDAMRSLSACGPWDAVIDTSGYIPRTVLHGARGLHEAVGRYVFVSSAAAYRDWPERHVSDESAIRNCPPDATGSPPGSVRPFAPQRYGELKAGCERAVRSVFGDRSTMLRAGVLVGPYEYVGRLPWWLRRVRRGGTVLAPGDPNRQVQVTDVRDIAAFALDVAVRSQDTSFNLTTPLDGSLTFARMLHACRLTTGSTASFTWVDDGLLQRCGISPFTELPLWQPGPRTWTVAGDRARAAGFSCRPIEETVHDTWAWMTTGDPAVAHPRHDEHGMEPAKERRILTTWRLRKELGHAHEAARGTGPEAVPPPRRQRRVPDRRD